MKTHRHTRSDADNLILLDEITGRARALMPQAQDMAELANYTWAFAAAKRQILREMQIRQELRRRRMGFNLSNVN